MFFLGNLKIGSRVSDPDGFLSLHIRHFSLRVDMSPEDMDSFIFCIASKRSAGRLSKEMYDLNTYCPEKRPADKYDIPGSYLVMSEVG